MYNTVRATFSGFCLLLVCSCTTTTVDENRQSNAVIEDGDSVVVLGRRHNSDYETEPSFIRCIGDRISRANGLRVFDELQFMNEFYPWFEPRTAPMALERLQGMLEIPEFAERMHRMGMHYIIWIDGRTERVDSMGSISCAVGPGGAGCLGFGAWENDSTYEATVWDVREFKPVAQMSATAEGTSYMPALIVPLPLIARVQASACDGLATQLETLFVME